MSVGWWSDCGFESFPMNSQGSYRLVIVLPYLKARGTEKQALMLARGLVALGWDIFLVVVMGYGESWLYEAFEKSGIKVINLGEPWYRNRKGVSWLRLPHLVRTLLFLRPDVVMSRALLANRLVGFASMITFVPFLATYSGGIDEPENSFSQSSLSSLIIRLQECIWRLLQNWPAKLVTVFRKSADHLSTIPSYSPVGDQSQMVLCALLCLILASEKKEPWLGIRRHHLRWFD